MSASHDTHHAEEQKPVAFTVPLILASVLILIIVLFLSLCDPKPHHHSDAAHGDHHATEAAHGHDAGHGHDAATAPATEHHDASAGAEVKADSTTHVETAAPHAEAEHNHAEGEHKH